MLTTLPTADTIPAHKKEKIMSKRKYYGNNSIGKNADIQRHRKDMAELIAIIEDCEARAAAGDKLANQEAATFRYCLRVLQESKAELASNLFKKKA